MHTRLATVKTVQKFVSIHKVPYLPSIFSQFPYYPDERAKPMPLTQFQIREKMIVRQPTIARHLSGEAAIYKLALLIGESFHKFLRVEAS